VIGRQSHRQHRPHLVGTPDIDTGGSAPVPPPQGAPREARCAPVCWWSGVLNAHQCRRQRQRAFEPSAQEVEHAPWGFASRSAAARRRRRRRSSSSSSGSSWQQQRHDALLSSPNTDTRPRPATQWPGRRPRQQALALGAALRCQSRRLFSSPWSIAPPSPPPPAPARPPRAPVSTDLTRQRQPERPAPPQVP
jgi:hypothetical protein